MGVVRIDHGMTRASTVRVSTELAEIDGDAHCAHPLLLLGECNDNKAKCSYAQDGDGEPLGRAVRASRLVDSSRALVRNPLGIDRVGKITRVCKVNKLM